MEENQNKEISSEEVEPEKELEKEKNIDENAKEESMIEVKAKKRTKGSYFTGIIGAILGGLVASLLWILTYIFTNNVVIPLFATFIPIGSFLGYKIFRGKTGKPFSVIITIVSLVIIILITTIICPSILILKSEYSVTWKNITGLYSNVRKENRAAIIEDTVAGLAFTIIGIVIVVKFFINKNMTKEQKKEEKRRLQEEKKAQLREQSKIIKNACLDLNSMNKEGAIKKKEILKQLVIIYNIKRKKAKLYFANCKSNKLLKKYKGKYYYNETDEEARIEKVKKIKTRYISKVTILVIILILAIIGATVTYMLNKKNKNMESESIKGVRIEADDTQEFYGTTEDITNAFGAEFANYYDFIINDKNKKYELYGMKIPATNYAGKDFATIMQEDRDYYAPYIGEEVISQVEDKQLGEHKLKSYNYTYTGNSGNQYRAIIYLYEAETTYLWINVYTDLDVELTQVDTIIDNLLK